MGQQSGARASGAAGLNHGARTSGAAGLDHGLARFSKV